MSTEAKAAPEAKDDKKQTVTVTYNGQPVQIEPGNYSLGKLRNRLDVPHDDILAQVINGAFQEVPGHIDIVGGEAFAAVVSVTYNGNPKLIQPGTYTVEKLRTTLGVPTNDVLSEFINGSFKDLTQGNVSVTGGEVFASHVPQGGAAHAG